MTGHEPVEEDDMKYAANERDVMGFTGRTARATLVESSGTHVAPWTATIRRWWSWLWDVPVDGPKATALLRVMAGSVFLWEGVMKFVFATQGVGRFTKLGFPFPGATADFVAVVE